MRTGLCLLFGLLALPATALVTSPTTTILQATEFQVTFDTNSHSTPVIGNDTNGDYIVYTDFPVGNYGNGISSIFYQRVANGQTNGAPVDVTETPLNAYLEDASGDYIVYTLSSAQNVPGNIILYQISTGASQMITRATVLGPEFAAIWWCG